MFEENGKPFGKKRTGPHNVQIDGLGKFLNTKFEIYKSSFLLVTFSELLIADLMNAIFIVENAPSKKSINVQITNLNICKAMNKVAR